MNRDIIAFTKYKFNVYGNKDIRSGKDSAVVGIVGKSKSLDFPTMLIFWSLVRNSVVLAVYLLFSVACFLTVHEHFDRDYLRRLENYTFDLYTQNQISFRQYVYLKRIQYFFSEIIHLNDYLKSKSFSPEYTKPVYLDEEKSFLIQKIEKYVKLFNHNNLSFDFYNIKISPVIYQQLLWLEKFELDSTESANNQTLTKEKLIEELNSFAISKQEYDETKTDNAARNDLLLNKGFPSNDKDNEPIYQKIQEIFIIYHKVSQVKCFVIFCDVCIKK